MKRALALLTVLALGRAEALDVPFRSRPARAGHAGEWTAAFSGDARAAGLADACAALPGAGAAFNPAGVLTERAEMSFVVAPLFSGGQFQALSVAQPLSTRDSAGLAVRHLASGEAERTDFLGQPAGTFRERNVAFLLTYGRRLGALEAGVSMSALNQSLADQAATGVGLDLGARWRAGRRWAFGAALQNAVRPRLRLREAADRPAPALRLGWALAFTVQDRACFWTVDSLWLGEAGARENRAASGLEAELVRGTAFPLWLRLGVNGREYAAGWGLGRGNFRIDYAAVFHELAMQHRVGVSLRYGVLSPFAERRLEERWKEVRRKEAELKRLQEDVEAARAAWLKETEGKKLLAEARRLFEEGRWEESRERLGWALELLPEEPAARALKDDLDRREASEAARQHIALARELFAAGRAAAAADALDHALALRHQDAALNAEALVLRAGILLAGKQYLAAERALQKVLKLDPGNREAAALHERLRDVVEAHEAGRRD